jgi:hypothetical protein
MELAAPLAPPPKKLALWDYPFPVILPGHEGTRRTVHPLPGTAAFPPLYLMDEASAPGRAQRTRYVARTPKGYRTMLAIHDPLTRQRCDRLQTAGMGLGLVRLLQDAGRTDEARATLSSLEDGFPGVAEEWDEPQFHSS